MYPKTFRITEYRPRLLSGDRRKTYGVIYLTLDKPNAGAPDYAKFYFVGDGVALSRNKREPKPGAEFGETFHTAYFAQSAFRDVVELLRNEEPPYLRWDLNDQCELGSQ